MKIQLRQSLLASAALSTLVLAGTAAPRTALANNECGTIGAGNPFTISCGTENETAGITYGNTDTDNATSTLFIFNNTQATNGLSILGSADGVFLTSNGAGRSITVDINQVLPGAAPNISGGLSPLAHASGFRVQTSGGTSAIAFTMDAGSITGGVGLSSGNGVRLTSSGAISPITFALNGGTITGGTALSAQGVFIQTSNTGSNISFTTGAGSLITAANGSGVQLNATGGSNIGDLSTPEGIAANTINGNITSTLAPGGVGIGTGLAANASGGDGNVALRVGPTGVIAGTGAGFVASTENAGDVTLIVDGNVQQTSDEAAPLSTLTIPVGVSGSNLDTGDVTITTNARSSVSQVGHAALIGDTEGIGISAITGSGAALITANGSVSATGIGVNSVSGSGTATATVGGNVTMTAGTGSGSSFFLGGGIIPPGIVPFVGDTVGASSLSITNTATTNLFGGNIGQAGDATFADIGLAAVVLGPGATTAATINVGNGTAQASNVFANSVGLLGINLGSGATNVNSHVLDPEGDLNVVNAGGIGLLGIGLGTGDVAVHSGTVNVSGANPLALPFLPFALSGGALGVSVGGGDVTTHTHGDIIVAGGGQFGAGAISFGGDATVISDAGTTIDPPIGDFAVTIGSGQAHVDNNATIISTAVGLLGVNIGDGEVLIENSETGVVDATGGGAGVLAIKFGPGSAAPLQPGNGDYSVVVSNDNANGGAGGEINAPDGPGVGVIALNLGPGLSNNVLVSNTNNASITGEGGSLLTATVGVLADGNVDILNDNNSTMDNDTGLGGLGLVVLAGGNVTATNDRSSDIIGTAGLVSLTGSTTFNNDNGSTWVSSGINVLAADVDATINNNNDAGIAMIGIGAVNLMAAGNNVTINNDNGADFVLAGLTGNFMFAGNDAVINNNNGATLNFIGLNGNLMVADNDTTINNENGAVINLIGLNFLGFVPDANAGGVGDSAVNNSSVINVTGFATFQGLEDFNNTDGLLDMRNGSADNFLPLPPGLSSPYDNVVGDVTSTDGNFNGGGTSSLGIDAFLGTPGAGSSSDLLLVDGNVTGATELLVNDLNPGAGGYNPTGILFAHVEGDSPEGSFFLSGGPIDKGFFSYDIVRLDVASFDWLLVSAPNDRAAELPALITGAQTIWYESTGVWLDRTADLRRQMSSCSPADEAQMSANVGDTKVTAAADVVAPECHYKRFGFWFRGYGGEYDRDSSNVEYDQDLWGGEAGLDVVVSGDADSGAFILGVLGGYLTSQMDFDSTGSNADFEGGTVGAYATYLNGGWYADLLFKANILDVDYETNFNDPENDASTDALSLGVRLDTGYRFDTDGGFFIEPQGTLAYVNTDLDDFSLLGTDVDPDDADSLRGRLGLRLGASWDSGSMIFEPFLVGSVWHEFEGDNEVTLTNGGTIAVSDEIDNTYGEVGGGLNMIDANGGLSLFAKVDALVGGDIESISGKVGGRIAW